MRNSPYRLAAVLAGAITLVPGADSAAWAQAQDPYGPRPSAAPAPGRDLSRVTPLLDVVDGTPRYQLVPSTSLSHSDAQASGMLAFSLQDNLPVDAGRSSPVTTGEHGGMPVEWHYLVKFWEAWPDAKDRPGQTVRLGEVRYDTVPGSTLPPPPPAVKAVLDAQADRFRDAILAYPFIRRSAGNMTRTSISYHRDRDPSGTEVWGYSLQVRFGPLMSDARQLPDGRWSSVSYDWMTLDICSNCFSKLAGPTGRYRGLQTMGHKALVDTVAAPIWVSEYRTGEGPLIPNPEVYDAARPATDIQLLVIDGPSGGIGSAAAQGPDNHHSRAVAATWLTDWKALVNQANGPAAPRAD